MATTTTKTDLVARDQSHLIHPLHDRQYHAKGHVWVHADGATKAEFPAEEKVGIKVHAEAQKRGLFSRLRGDVFCLAPPAIITEKQLDRIVEILAESVGEVLGE